MAYTLNTSHTLYGNLIELIGVQGGALVSHKTARTFTLDSGPAPTFGTGTYGESFILGKNGSWTSKGCSFSPGIAFNTYDNPNYSVFVVINTKGTVFTRCVLINGPIFAPHVWDSNVYAGVATNSVFTGSSLGSGGYSLCTSAVAESSGALYTNGVADGTAGSSDWKRTETGFSGIGNVDGYGNAEGLAIVWIAVFDKTLSAAETLSLHNSLGANNAFGLVSTGGTTYTLTLDTGSYTITGENLATPVSIVLNAEAGTYTITGESLATPGAFALALDAGTYTLIGSDVSLGGTTTYTITLDAGSYNIESFAPVINMALGLDTGEYSSVGSDLTLSVTSGSGTSYNLALEAGAYTDVGQDIGTILAYVMQLDQGSYSIDGKQVRLVSSTEPVILMSGNHTISISLKIGI